MLSSRMNSRTQEGGRIAFTFGIFFHSIVALFGGFVLGSALDIAVNVVAPKAFSGPALSESLPFVLSGAVFGVFATHRWPSRSAPWVALLGVAALLIAAGDLWFGWSPTWSHQTRSDYVLSQLFGVSGSCHDSECLYLLFFVFPFACLTAYSIAAWITLRLSHL